MILPAIREIKDIERFNTMNYDTCVILDTHIGHLTNILNLLKSADKKAYIHLDLIKGLSTDEAAVEYIVQKYKPAGIITTKPKLVKKANHLGVKTVLRVFILDTSALQRSFLLIQQAAPDFVEVMPGIASKVINQVKAKTDKPIIAGGLIETVEEVEAAIAHGAELITTSHRPLWEHYEPKP
ncbi:glycerol-3-phosphate responsive antiterminator [Macrococcus equipercicus]|uniref:Glycerol uptake operon antiterminator regulatory protein n=1 Tax=Macrococcus equipercicus TaxID=69967 RepID=A0A9Q9BUI0_9STAP|nr:glycerol-3-phosphate responsive antiterminator [Macrococcus equipercicus]KAA1040348.1 glycerol-3-phosphate responsive antiterminator [Macrococcus equipercicus]UTH14724.1 glycerol-3-phosphate responsive antiterminator [Macrococcus equipercicus]